MIDQKVDFTRVLRHQYCSLADSRRVPTTKARLAYAPQHSAIAALVSSSFPSSRAKHCNKAVMTAVLPTAADLAPFARLAFADHRNIYGKPDTSAELTMRLI